MELFRVGQVWSFEGRENDSNPCIIVLGIEPFRDTRAVHVQIIGVQMQTSDGQIVTEIGHVPVCEETIKNSVHTCLGETTVPANGLESIEVWREAGGGVYTIELKDIVTTIESIL